MAHQRRIRRAGFSLLELSVVVAIMGVVATLGLEVAASYANRSAHKETTVTVAQADIALRKFVRVYGRLPCPALRTRPLTNSLYGREDCGVPVTNGVRIGALPFRTLNLPLSASLDAYGSKLNYVVSQNLVTAGMAAGQFGNAASTGAIEIRNLGPLCVTSGTAGCPTALTSPATGEGAAYVVFSNGSDLRGAVSRNGVARVACVPIPAANFDERLDAQNCGSGVAPRNVFYDIGGINNGNVEANYTDDIFGNPNRSWWRKGEP